MSTPQTRTVQASALADNAPDIHARLEMARAALASIGQTVSPLVEELDIAVLVPCYNEAATIRQVVQQFAAALPGARVFVYDNNSTDNTSEEARAAGAIVRRERLQGKGNVVRRMFADIEADIYVMVDGDATYDAAAAPQLISRLIETNADMVVGARITEQKAAYRTGHRFGNLMLTGMVARVFGDHFTDMLSGYRIFSRRFVKSFPSLASGFEIETELTVHALELGMTTSEVQTTYFSRPPGSVSKLNTIRDGVRILATIGRLIRDERPLPFFGSIAAFLALIAALLGAPVLAEYFATGLVPRFPTAFLAATLGVLAMLSLTAGVVLSTVSLGRRESKRLTYIQIESIAARTERLASGRRQLRDARDGLFSSARKPTADIASPATAHASPLQDPAQASPDNGARQSA